jgi:hypothetical protein
MGLGLGGRASQFDYLELNPGALGMDDVILENPAQRAPENAHDQTWWLF